jgi:hypothetical protein
MDMKHTPFILMVLLLPALAGAQEDMAAYIEQMIERSGNGSGAVVNVESHSSVSTGGQVAGAGESVVTDGDVSASSHVETRINAGNDGGTIYVKTETSKNGETETEEYTKEIAPGEPVEVNVSAKASNEGSEVETEIQGETMEPTHEEAEETKSHVAIMARVETAFKVVPSFFKRVFSFVKFW